MNPANGLKHYGLQIRDDDTEAYVLGGLDALPQIILQPSGDWSSYLPLYEPQFGDSWDTAGCTVWGTQNAIEIMLKRVKGVEPNYSERFNYILADITPPGADPHHTIESIREHGLIDQALLPMTKTYEEFLTPKPMSDELLEEGLKFPFELKHEYVWRGSITQNERVKKIAEALQYSPLGVSVTAWFEENGVFVDRGEPNTHWCVLFGTDEVNMGWRVFDSYDQSIKTISFGHNIQICKRFHLEPSTKLLQVSLLKIIITKLQELINLLKAKIGGIINL